MKTTELIISELQKSLSLKGLKINKRESPVTSGYSEEWVIQDSEESTTAHQPYGYGMGLKKPVDQTASYF